MLDVTDAEIGAAEDARLAGLSSAAINRIPWS
jgi:hypothetical protein